LSNAPGFSEALLNWHGQYGRHDLPWQHPRSPYRVWVSEIMLQQTQVQTVIPYFNQFIARFPTLPDLAKASESAVMQSWAGLGYYSRARNLHKAAKVCMTLHDGELPHDFEALLALPGIGRTTAGAILSQAHGERFAIMDGNVKRVLTRFFAIEGDAASAHVGKQLWLVAESLLPETRLADYSQAVMDLGATVCTRSKPACTQCPLSLQCQARQSGTVLRFPGRKAIRKIPHREKHFLIMISAAGEILLERRPANGIWGGLYSLPEADDSESANRLARQFAKKFNGPEALLPMEHVFSHFRLSIRPLLFGNCTRKIQIADNDSKVWVPHAQLSEYGLPAPIKKLIGTLP
jgi:A/G-specific adenine glycosylase